MFCAVVIMALAAGPAAQADAPATPPAGQAAAAQPPAAGTPSSADGGFASETEKNSYALGYDYGRMMRTRKVEVVPEQIVAGLRDALGGAPGRLSDQDVTVLVRGIQNAAQRRMQQERADLSARNRSDGQAFLESNGKRPGVVVLPSGLQYEVLRPGTGAKPAIGQAVKVNFRGTLLDGTVFDSSFERNEPVVVRTDAVIPAWTEALAIMSVGAKWKLFVPAELGYGDRVAANVPPGATLIFEVELLSIEPAQGEKTPGSGGELR